jgi:hypothetical protein
MVAVMAAEPCDLDDDGYNDEISFWAALMAVTDTAVPTLVERFEARRPSWHADAACRGMGPEVFFTETAAPTAAEICATCKVASDCAAFGARESTGVWGGRARGFLPVEDPRPRRPKVYRLGVCAECAVETAIYAAACCNRCYQRRRRREAKRAS